MACDRLAVGVLTGNASIGDLWDAAYQIPRDLTFGPLLDACKAGEYDKCGQGIGQVEAGTAMFFIPGADVAAAPAVAVDVMRATELATAEAEATALAEAAAAQADAAAAAAEARALAEATRAAQAARAARAADLELGMDPATGVFREAEYQTAMRVQAERGVSLTRSADPGVDWVDANGITYDAVGNFKPEFFDQQWSNLQRRILDHMAKADLVPVDVSRFTEAQIAQVKDFVGPLGPRVFLVGE